VTNRAPVRSRARPTRAAPLPEGTEKRRTVEEMFDRIAARYDRLNRIISFGLDQRWRRHTVAALALPRGSRVLDVACGTGDLALALGGAGYPTVGIDLSAGMLHAANTSVPLLRGDALALPIADRSVDGLTCGFGLRNFVDGSRFFTECARVVRPGGRVAVLETADPSWVVMRRGRDVWLGAVAPWIASRLGSDADAYRYLPRSAAYLPPPGELVATLDTAGFRGVASRPLTGGVVRLLTGTREAGP